MAALRDRRTPAMVVLERIGPWPGRKRRAALLGAAHGASGARGGSLSAQHACKAWEDARSHTAREAWKIEKAAGRSGLEGLADFEFLCKLGRHVAFCARCVRAGREADTPISWLEWGVSTSGRLSDVWQALGGWSRGAPPGYREFLAARAAQGRERAV